MILSQTLTLLQQVKELELVAQKNTTGLLAGNYMSTVLGHGLEFHEARKYVPGESIRLIDWNMTARLGDVYVKRFREEREREVFLAVDVSPSMNFGTKKRTKLETAMEIAATLGFNAVQSQDRLGLVSFSDCVQNTFLPRKGRPYLFEILKSLVVQKNNPQTKVGHTDIKSAIQTIQAQKGRKFMIFLISDFIERDIPEDLKLIQDKHDVVMFHVYDPFEYHKSKHVFFPFHSPEGKRSSLSGKPGSFGEFKDVESFLKGSSLKYGIDVVSVSTQDIISKVLLGYFRQKAQRRLRS